MNGTNITDQTLMKYCFSNSLSFSYKIEQYFNKMNILIYPLHSESNPKNHTFIEHMKRIQYFSWFPLFLSSKSFSKVSKLFLSLSVLHVLVNLLHLWTPSLYVDWGGNGPFSTVVATILYVTYSALPAVFIMTALRRKTKFEETTRSLLWVLKELDLLEYRMFLSCKIVLFVFAFGILVSILTNIILYLFGRGLADTILAALNVAFTIYVLAWDFQFFYTIRTIQACFIKQTQSKINKSKLKQFFQFYNCLIEIGLEINEFYDYPVSVLLMIFLTFFIDVTGNILDPGNITDAEIGFMGFSSAVILFLVVCFLRNGQAASDQADTSNEALLKYLVLHKHTVLLDNQLLLIHLCARRKLIFRAAKSFTINYDLGISMISAYLTYIIVLLKIEHTRSSHSLDPNNAPNSTYPESS